MLYEVITGFRGPDLGRVAAVDQPARQVPAEIDDVRARQGLEQLGIARSDAGQRGQGRKQGKENFGSQDGPSGGQALTGGVEVSISYPAPRRPGQAFPTDPQDPCRKAWRFVASD